MNNDAIVDDVKLEEELNETEAQENEESNKKEDSMEELSKESNETALLYGSLSFS